MPCAAGGEIGVDLVRRIRVVEYQQPFAILPQPAAHRLNDHALSGINQLQLLRILPHSHAPTLPHSPFILESP
jgi:hypothetical protein